MPTYITVLSAGTADHPHTAVQACRHRVPLERYRYYNSQMRQNFPFHGTDVMIGSKTIINIKTGLPINVQMYELQANENINEGIKVPGCDMVNAFGMTDSIVSFVDEWNALGAEKVKLSIAKKKLKDNK